MTIEVDLEEWRPSPVIRVAGRNYVRKPVTAYRDEAAQLTSRQAVFYRNLIRIAEATGSKKIPVDFDLPNGIRYYLDRGCLKIAEHARFIEPLANDCAGVVSTIRLTFAVSISDQ